MKTFIGIDNFNLLSTPTFSSSVFRLMKLQTVIAVIVREQVYSHGLFSFVF